MYVTSRSWGLVSGVRSLLCAAAEAGKRVVVLEMGRRLTPAHLRPAQ